ncbi:S1C family serine protease [Gryllotalpicola reticulitermitis]|uniref:S1C family serine protease n=1 Tax=Gryllotalpicola reticulitermitis TaxID=1184153 RepID=A0ABV8Q2U0_9MICO
MSEPSETPGTAAAPGSGPLQPDRRRLRWLLGLTVVAALVLGAAGGAVAGLSLHSGRTNAAGATSGGGSGTAAATSKSCDAVSVAQSVLPSVVTVSTVSAAGESGVGSGEVIRADGYIVTNNHVISSAASGGQISVTFSDGTTLPAELTGRDPRSDLAVLKVSTSRHLPVISLADSDKVVVGQPVVALGAPLGLSSTVTAGIVSALDRNVPVPSDAGSSTVLAGAIQTDAAINPGNSGGALVDCDGHLVGVNTAIATVPNAAGQAGGGSVGIGFAVPSNLAAHVAGQIIAGQPIGYAYLGFQAAPVMSQAGEPVGLFVQAVTAGGPADSAGLRTGDLITHIEGNPVHDLNPLMALMTTKSPGDRVSLQYVRDGATHQTTITLGTQ